MDLSCNKNGCFDNQTIPKLFAFEQKRKSNSVTSLRHGSISREHYWQQGYVSDETLQNKAICKENVKPLQTDRSQQEAIAHTVFSHQQQYAEADQAVSCEQRQPLCDISPLPGGVQPHANSPSKRKAAPVDAIPFKKLSPEIQRDGESTGKKHSPFNGEQSDVFGKGEMIVSTESRRSLSIASSVARAITFDMANDHGWFKQNNDDEILPRLKQLLEATPVSSGEEIDAFAQEYQDWVFALHYHLYRKAAGFEADTLVAIYRQLADLMVGWRRHHEAAMLFSLLAGRLVYHPNHWKVMQGSKLKNENFLQECTSGRMSQLLLLNNQDHGMYLRRLQSEKEVRDAVAKELDVSLPQCPGVLAVSLRLSHQKVLENAMAGYVEGSNDIMIMRLLRDAPYQRIEECTNRAAGQGLLCECHRLPKPENM